MATYWITKHVLTHGIFEFDGEVDRCDGKLLLPKENIACAGGVPWRMIQRYHGKEWHRTREEAEARGHELIARKVASLKKQLAKLEGATFNEDGSLCPACKVK